MIYRNGNYDDTSMMKTRYLRVERRDNNFLFFRWLVFEYESIKVWAKLKEVISYLSVRSSNKDPVENLLWNIRQHGISNLIPACFQFTAALKPILVNSISQSANEKSDMITVLQWIIYANSGK